MFTFQVLGAGTAKEEGIPPVEGKIVSVNLEVERKYDVGAGFRVPDLRGVAGCADVGTSRTRTLTALYFDTPDLRLISRGVTLRHRTGDDEGWDLRLPAGEGRREIHDPAGREEGVPERLARLVTAFVRGRELVPVAELTTVRTERSLLAETGAVLAELADDTVTARRLDDPTTAPDRRSWREIGVELVSGRPDVLDAVGKRLRKAGARVGRSSSRLSIALGGGEDRPGCQGGTDTAAEVLTSYLGRQSEALLAYDPLVRLAEHDDDSVHKMRVAARRIRSVLRTHRKLLEQQRTRALDAELRWLTDALGEVRDLEVLRARFDRRLAAIPEVDGRPAFMVGLAARERQARERLRQTLSSPRYAALLDSLDIFVADPPVTERATGKPEKQTAKVIGRAWRKMLRAYAEAEGRPAGVDRDGSLHRTRKAAKRLRYTAEAAAPALGKPARKLARRAERVQDVLGVYQDGVVAARQARRLADEPGGRPGDLYTLGVLAGDSRRAAQQAGDEIAGVWEKAVSR
ncbi:CYTH and CHAD domain-containing protein [Actinomadura rubrisoli]|uniref:CYTH and CHAD domain-containing protein n=2 Tax=Actinomadura rubrisoli TaxID=2530368 RepID=A0A4R4ZS42_9ACTN|nr:CYTH and CHAD domain-containing protein [Actinomadura rubrisoli]